MLLFGSSSESVTTLARHSIKLAGKGMDGVRRHRTQQDLPDNSWTQQPANIITGKLIYWNVGMFGNVRFSCACQC